jgi:hypothetical protein
MICKHNAKKKFKLIEMEKGEERQPSGYCPENCKKNGPQDRYKYQGKVYSRGHRDP